MRRVDLALLAVAVVWGSSYLAAKETVTADSVFAFLAVRLGIAVVVLAMLTHRRLRHLGPAEVRSGVLFGAILTAVLLCETYGVTMTSASNAGLIVALTIVLTPLCQRAAVPPAFYAAAACAVLGCALLTQSGGWAAPGAGDLLVGVAAVLRAVHVTVIDRTTARRETDPAATTFVQLATVTVLCALFAAAGGQLGSLARVSASGWILTVYLAVACTVFAFWVQMWALGRTSPARVSLLLGTEPLWAVLVGIGLAGDRLSVVGVLGALLLLGGTGWGRAVLTRFQLQVGVPAGEADRDIGDQRVEEPLPVQGVDAGADGEIEPGQHRDEQRRVHDGLGYRDVDAEPGAGAGWGSDRAALFGRPQHGHVIGDRDDAQRQEEGEQSGREQHHLNRL
ncbi:DMT family transporter [Mycolicibacterium fluoranthenivorans]|uniref:DMT family transporter n=1 Tax=Mycolicibacterium fluoranthenivorans TaxID=258505 RepID=A0A7G8P7Y3_9MYCO|nr:DMT family transporter [Mycolicibacterium fluoranthenivorans]